MKMVLTLVKGGNETDFLVYKQNINFSSIGAPGEGEVWQFPCQRIPGRKASPNGHKTTSENLAVKLIVFG